MMLGLIAWGIVAVQVALALPFLIELIAGLPASRPQARDRADPLPRTTVLMPAHDEGLHIATTVGALNAALPASMDLLLVADNCSDNTAEQARRVGATVVERHDSRLRGKGHALAFGRERIRDNPPEVVIVLDADCRVEPGALDRLAVAARDRASPVQGLYLLTPNHQAPAMVQVSGFAFAVKNLVRQRGLARIGAPLPLGGSGMALPWAQFRDAPLGGSHLVEDLALSIALARDRHPARFVPEAVIWSDPAGAEATLAQRARWEGGFLQVARTHGLALLGEGLRRGRPGLLWMGLHVLTPPLALLVALEGALTGLVALMSLMAGRLGALAGSVALLLLIAGAVLAAWVRWGRPWLSAGALARLPLYLVWKLPNYLRLARGRGPQGWVRTSREP